MFFYLKTAFSYKKHVFVTNEELEGLGQDFEKVTTDCMFPTSSTIKRLDF